MTVFYILAALVLLQSLVSLRGGFRYLAFVRRETKRELSPFAPFASVIVPCRGVDQDLRENFDALFTQDYPAFELIFVSDHADDPALSVARELSESCRDGNVVRVSFVVAGAAHDSGQKVHNLRAAVNEIDPASEALVFVDTDARPRKDWLRRLVGPLSEERVGAATGYRWFIPRRGGPASHLRSVWNASIASALGADGRRNFCWGGSTAIRRETFELLNVRERWRGTLSDDYALTRMLNEAGLPIRFVPASLTPSIEDCTLRELFEFTTRQLKITRVYAPHLWRLVLFSNLLFTLVFWGGIAIILTRAALGLSYVWPLAIVCTVFLFGTLKAALRLKAVVLPLAEWRAHLRQGAWAHLTLWPATSVLYLCNALAAGFSRRITWRGITYELISPTETAIIR